MLRSDFVMTLKRVQIGAPVLNLPNLNSDVTSEWSYAQKSSPVLWLVIDNINQHRQKKPLNPPVDITLQ